MEAIDLIDKTKVYQFIKKTDSRNTTDKLKLPKDLKALDILLKSIEKAMKKIDSL